MKIYIDVTGLSFGEALAACGMAIREKEAALNLTVKKGEATGQWRWSSLGLTDGMAVYGVKARI